MRRLAVALAVLALLLAGCSDVDTSSGKPTFGGGSLDGGDPQSASVRSAVQDAGVRPCSDLPLADAGAEGDGALPALELPCLGGDGSVDLSRLRGPAVVNFWASNCKPCREELPLLARLDRDTGDRLTVVGLDVRDADPDAAPHGADRPPVVHAAGAVDASGGEEHLLGYCGFTCIDMGDKPDIPDAFNGKRGFHQTGHWILTMKTGLRGLQEGTLKRITYGSAQRPGWLPPSGAVPPFYGLPFPRPGRRPLILAPILAA